jgi:hypothetical protein
MAFSEDIIWKVWSKGEIDSNDPLLWRKDVCGAWMFRAHYGNRDSQYGWEIDHIKPLTEGGTHDISNRRPLQWENNVRKTDGTLRCIVKAEGSDNIKTDLENL